MNKAALVTGGSGDIGQAICRRLSKDGYFVIVNYLHSKKSAETLAEEIGGTAVRFDVSDRKETEDAISGLLRKYPETDLLVNNAGVSAIDVFQNLDKNISDRIIGTNLGGTMNCSRAVLPDMIRRKSGVIINISSMWGQCGASCEVDYSASKAGVIGFTKALAKEAGPSGIRVNCVSPGFISTGMNSGFTPGELEDIRNEIPLGIFGKPEHIADAVAFLASDEAGYITGQILAVNGGMVI